MNKKDFASSVRGYNGDGVTTIGADGLVYVPRDKVAARMAVENSYNGGSDIVRRIKFGIKNGKLAKTEYYVDAAGDVIGASVKDINMETLQEELKGSKGRDVAKSVLFDKPFYETDRDNER